MTREQAICIVEGFEIHLLRKYSTLTISCKEDLIQQVMEHPYPTLFTGEVKFKNLSIGFEM